MERVQSVPFFTLSELKTLDIRKFYLFEVKSFPYFKVVTRCSRGSKDFHYWCDGQWFTASIENYAKTWRLWSLPETPLWYQTDASYWKTVLDDEASEEGDVTHE